jgi:hypothetical protein
MFTQDMTREEFDAFVKAHDWRFAKSMPQIPHAYVVREKCRDDEEFCKAVLFIRQWGQPRKFFRKTFLYLDVGAYSYWTMGAPVFETTIINRALI